MVLGIQWLSQLGTIQWNFKTLQMEFCWKGKRHVLRELQRPKVKIIQGTQLPQAMEEGFHLCMMQLLLKPGVYAEDWCYLNLHQEAIPNQLSPLLNQYSDLFSKPVGLPPSRGVFDHKIPLKPETKAHQY